MFKQAFHCNVNAVVPDDLAQFLASLKLSPRSYNNFLGALRKFFRYAQKHNSKAIDLLARVEKRVRKRSAA
jgi:site-specific recombinase XerD